MLIYWLLVIIPLLLSLVERPHHQSESRVFVIATSIILFVFLAFRETGGDYGSYLKMFQIVEERSLDEYLTRPDPLYGLCNWISAQLGWGFLGVNVICAMLFLACLYRAAIDEPLPMFFIALSIPYFVIVVAMGYTRQGVASGLVLSGIVALRSGSPLQFSMQICLAAGFHASALAMLPALLFAKLSFRNKFLRNLVRVFLLGLGAFGGYHLLSDSADHYVEQYVERDHYKSGGAVLRAAVTAAAAAIFFVKRRQWRSRFGDNESLTYFALLALFTFFIAFVASTPADRMGLYLIPFQLIVFARLPLMQKTMSQFSRYRLGIATFYVAYFYVWLILGTYSQKLWVPYKSVLW